MSKIAIVIGATGLVGQALVDHLVNAAHIEKIVTLTRRPAHHRSKKVVNHCIDFTDLQAQASLFAGDLLFSCLGTTVKQAGSIAAQRVVDIDYQFEAAQLAVNHGVQDYLLVSSSGANARSHNQYLKMKGELETKVKDLPFRHIGIFQPSLLVGARASVRPGEKIASWLLFLLGFIPSLRPISGEQVAKKMSQASAQMTTPLTYYRRGEIFT